MIKLPGLVDPHVHLRDPGQTTKEDGFSGTSAALAGGFTQILAMPNTSPPIADAKGAKFAIQVLEKKIVCDVGLFAAALNDNLERVSETFEYVVGLKMWLDSSFGNFLLADARKVEEHFANWPSTSPIVVHAEGGGRFSLGFVLGLSHLYNRKVHILHVARQDEILLIRRAKERGVPVTCETCPQYLLLSSEEQEGKDQVWTDARPQIGSSSDRKALWENMDIIDIFGSDHAPHTKAEKLSDHPVPGMPGLETSLAILLGFVHVGRLTLDDLVKRMSTNPNRIFSLPEQENTWIEVNLDKEWHVKGDDLFSRCGWSPFEGMQMKGRVDRVVLRGDVVYDGGQVLAQPGFGKLIATR